MSWHLQEPLAASRVSKYTLYGFERFACEMMAFDEVFGGIKAQIDLPFLGFPGEGFQRKINRE